MEIISKKLAEIIQKQDELLRKYYDEQLYTRLVEQNREHLLVKLKQELDFTEMERASRGYHHGGGPGAPPTHTVDKLVRAVLLKRMYGLSLREMEEQLKLNLLYRWFVGYGLWENTPDHSTLQRFEEWMEREAPRMYFDAVLKQIYERYPQEREQDQMGDTYGMKANAARQGRVKMWRKLGKQVEEEIKAAGKEEELAGWDETRLYGEKGEKRQWEMSKEEKQERIEKTALGAQALITRAQRALEGQESEALAYLEKTLADEVEIEGEQVTVREQKGAYRIRSVTDPEATLRNHGDRDGEPDLTFGYNVQVAATVNGLITEVQARTGATPDQEGIADLVAQQQEHHDIVPSKLIYDAAAGSGKTRHEVAKAGDDKTKTMVSAPLPGYANRSKRFGPYDFTLSADGESLTCPAGKETRISYRSGSGEGRSFRFCWFHCWEEKPPAWMKKADLSKRCPLWEQCRSKKQGPRKMRQVFVSDYRKEVEAAAAYNQSEAYKQDRKQRPKIERVIAELTRYNDARHCRKRGLRSADWQAKMSAVAYNLKWWMRRVEAKNALSPP